MRQPQIGGVIISAGFSERMGSLKPLIIYDGKPFLIHIILKLNMVCQKIVIVTGYKSSIVKKEIISWLKRHNQKVQSKIIWNYNPDYDKGMLTSLQNGLPLLKDCSWILYHFADQPDIPEQFYKMFINQITDAYNWIQPVYQNISGHPLLISNQLIKPILDLDHSKSLRDLAEKATIHRKMWPTNFAEILQDYDTPQQLKKLMENINGYF